ncbi:ABC transporter substrate-binding protein [Verticiella sediminum]|uniref:ABC transporter substrate-binding protein n=1 Tax=Verticiella sediminum TaxID=1247510 RepID=A0A556AWU5_9BURK|nr:substrate-binding domain-containing protein [Verticiella sediminum]TSH97386.1 ABC transporter substrate-binding protein [Verticiella sediminum]
MTAVRVFATLALQGVIEQARSELEAAAAMGLDVRFAPTADLMACIGRGEEADVAVLTRGAIEDLIGRGLLTTDNRIDLAVSHIAAAVKAGAPHPDIGTLDAFQSALLEARSVAYSRTGISGSHFADLIERLGIASALNARAQVPSGGFTATLLVDGRCDLAIQQLSELRVVPGIEIVGHLPEGAQLATVFTAGRFARSAVADAAAAVISCLASPLLQPVFQKCGLDVPAT